MKTLTSLLNEPGQRKSLIDDCTSLIDNEVKNKSGLAGIAVKTAYAVVKAIKPRVIEDSVDVLLDEFVGHLDGHFKRYQEAGSVGSFEAYVRTNRSNVADSLLTVTDRRAERATNKTILKAYSKLRPKGKSYVEEAVPGVGRVVDKYIPRLT